MPPSNGAAGRCAISDLEEKLRDLIVLRTDADLRIPYDMAVRDFELDWTYDLPPDATEALAEYHESKRELAEAQARYSERAQRAASALTTSAHASVRDVGWLMGISYQRVAQLLTQLRRGTRT